MDINKDILFTAIKKMKKDELLELLDDAYENMDRQTQRYVFWNLYNTITAKERTPQKLLAEIKLFYKKSMEGDYYSDFLPNSKSFSDMPEATEEWFGILSNYLDITSELSESKNYKLSTECFKLLFELIDGMENGEAIVFADELGDWRINAKSDYVENYIIGLGKTTTIEKYTEILIPMIQNDSYLSFSKKVYQKTQKHASPEQIEAINREVKLRSIQIK